MKFWVLTGYWFRFHLASPWRVTLCVYFSLIEILLESCLLRLIRRNGVCLSSAYESISVLLVEKFIASLFSWVMVFRDVWSKSMQVFLFWSSKPFHRRGLDGIELFARLQCGCSQLRFSFLFNDSLIQQFTQCPCQGRYGFNKHRAYKMNDRVKENYNYLNLNLTLFILSYNSICVSM